MPRWKMRSLGDEISSIDASPRISSQSQTLCGLRRNRRIHPQRIFPGCKGRFLQREMELLSLHSPPAARPPRYLPRGPRPRSFLSGQPLASRSTSSSNRRPPVAKGHSFIRFNPRAAGPSKVETGSNLKAAEDIKEELSTKDSSLVFVAGATGRVGSRTVRELLKLGFCVRAGVRSVQRAATLVQSVREMKLDDATLTTSQVQPVERLEIVECNLENEEEIGPAIGNASIVTCCIGASEKEVFDFTGPYRIDYKATKNLIDAATVAKVDHFILVTSLGTNKIGFPAALLNLFWGVLFWKRKAEEVLIASGLPYTIVRPGGMERPTDAFKETHNIILANEDTYFGGLVSNLQVAELIAFMAKNRSLSFCKVVEVIAETTAPLTPMGELLAKIPAQRVDTSLSKDIQVKDKVSPTAPSVLSPISNDVKEEPIQARVQKMKPLSPYTAYDDFKPPTSPSPSAPSTEPASLESTIDGSPTSSAAPSNKTKPTLANLDKAYVKQVKTKPLSPFTMYEDLKPPTSPTPSLPKH